MTNFFLEELRKIYGDGRVIHDPQFVGECCYGSLGDLRVKARFTKDIVANQYPVLSHWHNPRCLACPPAGAVSWRRFAGAAAEPDISIGAADEYHMDRQKPAHHPHLPCRLWHGSFALSDESGQNPRRRGTRLRGVGDTCIRQRAVRAEGQHPTDPARPTRSGYPQAPPPPQRAGHRRQRRGQNAQLCAAEYPDRKHELRHYGPKI